MRATDPVAKRTGDRTGDTTQAALIFSRTLLDNELGEAQGKWSGFLEALAPKLPLWEDLAAAPGRRIRLLALVAGLVLATGSGGYWFSRQLSEQESDVLAQPVQAVLASQAPTGPVNPSPTPEGTTISNTGASANVGPPARESERVLSQNPGQGQTASKFVLQMATFQSPERAARALQEFHDAGFRAYSIGVSLRDGVQALAVFLGPYAELAAAQQDLARARQIPGYDSGRVVQVGSPVPTPKLQL